MVRTVLAPAALLLTGFLLLRLSRPLQSEQPMLAQLVDEQLARASDLEQQAHKLAAAAAESGAGREAAAAAQLHLEAEAAYRAAIMIDPTDPLPLYHLGHVLRARGPATTAESLAHFDRAWVLDPDNPAVVSSLGYLLIAAAGGAAAAKEMPPEAALAHQRRGLQVLAQGVNRGIWPRSDAVWQHPMEWLQVVPPPPPSAIVRTRAPYDCMLKPLERHANSMGSEAAALLPRFSVQTEGLSRPHGGWRDYELWRRCGLRKGKSNDVLPTPPAAPGLTATCAALQEMATAAPGAKIHSASFSAISPGTVLLPHCGPNNGRLVMHVGLKVRDADDARLRLGRPSTLNETASELRARGLPGAEPTEVAWRTGEGFVWDDSTSHEVVWRGSDARLHSDSVAVASGDEFAATEPRIILLLLFFHPTLTRAAVCDPGYVHRSTEL